MQDFSGKNTTLVHICCSVDSHHFLTKLIEKYPEKNFCGFFYNPNIHPFDEYKLRLMDVERSCKRLGIPLIVGDYHLKEWLDGSKGLEDAPEKGERCSYCFDFRLEESAKVAIKNNCAEFTTTLLASPMKSQGELFSQGQKIAQKYNLEFLPIDVRSNGGTKEQNELAKQEQLYRQNYCGCLYALSAQRKKASKIPLELISSLNATKTEKNLPNIRLKNFKFRQNLEKSNKPYKIIKRKVQKYQLLKGVLECDGGVVPSFICSYSMLNKPTKAKIDFYHNGVGYANKDGILILDFSFFKEFLGVESFEILLKEGLSEERQLKLRQTLYNQAFFAAPIVIIKEKLESEFKLDISYILQEEVLEEILEL
ncbi:MAG: epoxyqueuosine reductase QueH [Helicobacter sp.]|nr:epoxyqueuosine reductase QueH [Helicobacter sp.]